LSEVFKDKKVKKNSGGKGIHPNEHLLLDRVEEDGEGGRLQVLAQPRHALEEAADDRVVGP
jgi:hypothetical protein